VMSLTPVRRESRRESGELALAAQDGMRRPRNGGPGAEQVTGVAVAGAATAKNSRLEGITVIF
jgi:hypothetical protein